MLDFSRLIMAALIVFWIFLVFLIFRVNVVYKNHMIITDAILEYRLDKIHSTDDYKEISELFANPDVDYEDMELFEATLFRLWDFGYKNILPLEKFELIEPFIF